MRLKQHEVIRPFLVTAITTMIAALLTLAFGAGVGRAESAKEYYVDGKANVCVGNTFAPPFCNWTELTVLGGGNTALGDAALFGLTGGAENTSVGHAALFANTTGQQN